MLAYRYNQKSYQVLVNACTGEVQGERPWSWIKIGLASFALLTTVGLIYVSSGVRSPAENGGKASEELEAKGPQPYGVVI